MDLPQCRQFAQQKIHFLSLKFLPCGHSYKLWKYLYVYLGLTMGPHRITMYTNYCNYLTKSFTILVWSLSQCSHIFTYMQIYVALELSNLRIFTIECHNCVKSFNIQCWRNTIHCRWMNCNPSTVRHGPHHEPFQHVCNPGWLRQVHQNVSLPHLICTWNHTITATSYCLCRCNQIDWNL